MEPILASQCVEQSLPIGRLLELMIDQDLLFVLDGSHVAWMLNHSDLSAPAVSIAVLAHLAAIEEGVKELAKEYSQTHVFETMSAGREKADENFRMLKQKNIEVSLLDCFYFKDWMAFVRKTDDLRNALGFPSRDEFRNFAKVLSDLRNHTAHGRGILAGSSDPRKALSNVGRAIDFARKVWQLVDQQLPIWDRFASTEIVFPKGAKTPLAGVAARKSWPWSGACHVITAWNPAGIWSHDSQNRKANSRLAENLKRHNYLFEPVIGRSPDGKWREESFLVHGLRRQQAADLGLDFAQTAVFELDKDNLNVVRCSDGEVVRTRSRLQDPSDIC